MNFSTFSDEENRFLIWFSSRDYNLNFLKYRLKNMLNIMSKPWTNDGSSQNVTNKRELSTQVIVQIMMLIVIFYTGFHALSCRTQNQKLAKFLTLFRQCPQLEHPFSCFSISKVTNDGISINCLETLLRPLGTPDANGNDFLTKKIITMGVGGPCSLNGLNRPLLRHCARLLYTSEVFIKVQVFITGC